MFRFPTTGTRCPPLLVASVLLTACTDSGALVARRAPGEAALGQLYSVQMHVHGSFSEGVGSIDSHSHEASDLGVDVIWWSDHDFRITSYRHVTRFGFEDWNETVDRGEAWRARPDRDQLKNSRKTFRRDVGHQIHAASAEFSVDQPKEGRHSLRVRAASEAPQFERHAFSMAATRDLYRRPLAVEATVSIAIRPMELGPDARAVVVIGLSEHAPHADVPRAVYALRYVLDNGGGDPFRHGAVYTIPLAFRTGEWNVFDLPVTADAVAGFPFLHARDNSLHELSVGVEARRGATADAFFDQLEVRQLHSGPEVFRIQRELLSEVARDYPDVRQLQGVEVSYTRTHLNEFSVDTGLLDYDKLLAESDAPYAQVSSPGAFDALVTRRAVAAAHDRGGLISYNHLFGVSVERDGARQSKEQVLRKLTAHRLYGADILEVGYRARGCHDLADHLWVWDELARAGIRVVGTGVSDSHGGRGGRWRGSPNNFVSWIYADSPEKADLIEGLRNGRVFFGGPGRFDGKLDLWTDAGQRMGATVTTTSSRATIHIALEGCVAGDTLRILQAGELIATHAVARSAFHVTEEISLPRGAATWVRVELHDDQGHGKVFSNPIYFLRPETEPR